MYLVSGAWYETHLNTFFCPVGTEPVLTPKTADRNTTIIPTALKIYPNPTFSAATLTIEGGQFATGAFVLQDLTGKVLHNTQVIHNQVVLGNQILPNGVYFFKILDDGQEVGNGKMVVVN